jgi:hypothetical protein
MLSVMLVHLLRGGLLSMLATTAAATGGPGNGIEPVLAALLLARRLVAEGVLALTHDGRGSVHGGIESGLLPVLLRLLLLLVTGRVVLRGGGTLVFGGNKALATSEPGAEELAVTLFDKITVRVDVGPGLTTLLGGAETGSEIRSVRHVADLDVY